MPTEPDRATGDDFLEDFNLDDVDLDAVLEGAAPSQGEENKKKKQASGAPSDAKAGTGSPADDGSGGAVESLELEDEDVVSDEELASFLEEDAEDVSSAGEEEVEEAQELTEEDLLGDDDLLSDEDEAGAVEDLLEDEAPAAGVEVEVEAEEDIDIDELLSAAGEGDDGAEAAPAEEIVAEVEADEVGAVSAADEVGDIAESDLVAEEEEVSDDDMAAFADEFAEAGDSGGEASEAGDLAGAAVAGAADEAAAKPRKGRGPRSSKFKAPPKGRGRGRGRKPREREVAAVAAAKVPVKGSVRFICSECYEEFLLPSDYSSETVACPECLHVGKRPDDEFLRTVNVHKAGERKSFVAALAVGIVLIVVLTFLVWLRSPFCDLDIALDAAKAGTLKNLTLGLLAGGGLLAAVFIWLLTRFESNRWEVYF